ncbi:ABC transporter substrate-binding protein [Thermoanaerobacterium thermosaccharolyticum]|jgi:putative aldouronate transport system substrate-binding protein|uniref:ABC transporter substrate-binding protein n=1 Tax=Thermoanaerobacterium thermosaccharolyticum TaxID=1517 RepID=UPI00177F8D8F|nr:ABC transporter substrate-binding protein [Thermoanaerobacterium thermosaccharolyticum]MBE0069645.1 extracellular solute-binding protein [Thermoanaerobacterium thermosaccharolyticum]MBE0229344.1 extracellular solute-binding protein [Thermoanaerobacterium thermosaccharolyticum]
MKSQLRSLIAIFLTVILTLTLIMTGCGTIKNSGTNVTQNAKNPDAKITLRMMIPVSTLEPPDPNEKLIFKRWEKKTGIHVDWITFPSDSFAEKRNLALASGDLPDAIFNAGLSDSDILKLAKDGTIIPLDDIIEKYMPNFKKVLQERPIYKALITAPDGHIYSLPWIEELGWGKELIHSVNDIPWINVEWLQKLGLKMPETTDDLLNVLRAFKKYDPAGGGKTIPMSFINSLGGNEDLSFLFGSFGLGMNWDLTLVSNDGKVTFAASNDGYKEAVKFVHELYKEGLIDPDAFTQDWNTYIAKGKEGRYGLYFTWDKGNVTGMKDKYEPALEEGKKWPNDLKDPYQPLPPLKGPNGWINVTRTNGLGLDRGRFVITKADKNIEATARWIDNAYDPLQSPQNNWGTYGDTTQQNVFEFDTKNNMLRHLPLNGTAPAEIRTKTCVGGPLAVLDSYYGKYVTLPDDANWRLDIIKHLYTPYMKSENIYPKAFFTLEHLQRISAIEADLMPYVLRKRTEWIQNGKIDQEWDSYLKELNRLGLQEWLKIKQDEYNRYMKTIAKIENKW